MPGNFTIVNENQFVMEKNLEEIDKETRNALLEFIDYALRDYKSSLGLKVSSIDSNSQQAVMSQNNNSVNQDNNLKLDKCHSQPFNNPNQLNCKPNEPIYSFIDQSIPCNNNIPMNYNNCNNNISVHKHYHQSGNVFTTSKFQVLKFHNAQF